MSIKPLLAADAKDLVPKSEDRPLTKDDLAKLKYPLLASPKLDGIRAVAQSNDLLARSLKPIRNEFIRSKVLTAQGLDGELVVGDPTAENCFNVSTSGVMSRDGSPPFTFFVFDLVNIGLTVPFRERLEALHRRVAGLYNPYISVVPHDEIADPDQLVEYYEQKMLLGYEGVMLRDPNGVYKTGRSTLREGILTKLKPLEDDEAEIVGVYEMMHNANEAFENELGHTARSGHKENLVPKGILGGFNCLSERWEKEFNVGHGIGWTHEFRRKVWENPDEYVGKKILKYRFQAVGSKDRPRIPKGVGFRDKDDL